MLYDTHCHLYKEYYDDIESIIIKAKDNGVEKYISDATNIDTCYEMLELAKMYPDIYITLGIHPECVEDSFPELEKLVKENQITWISDNGPVEMEDRFVFYPLDENTYHFDFIRNDKPTDFGFKSPFGISVRIRNSGSNYDPFNCVLMRMFQKLQEVDNDYHQIHFEELEYKRLLKK